MLWKYKPSHPHSVGTHDLLFLVVPKEKMVIIIVKAIEVNRFVGPFSDGPEGNFPLPSYFLEYKRHILLLGQKYLVVATLQQAAILFP